MVLVLSIIYVFMAGCSGGGGGGGSSSGGSGSGTDTTAPTVISTSPATNATGVDVNTTINVTFSETMNPLTVNKFNFTLSQGANSVSGTVTYSGTTATFTPSANLAYETTYAATITAGVKDLAGNAMALNYTWTFSTSSPRIASINISGAHLLAMAVYEGGNRIFVADDDSESLHVIDGGTNQIIATIPNVGGAVFQIAVNETYGKVYVASDKQCCTTGITPGTGLISVINANTHQIIKQINPGDQGNVSYFIMGNDEVHDKVYVAFYSGVGVIDAATDQFTLIVPNTSFPHLDKIGINTVTNEIFLPALSGGVLVINGDTLAFQSIPYPTGASGALDVAVNEIENKVYITMVTIPGQGFMGISILDRNTGEYKFVGADDLEPVAFNNVSNKLFTGVQVGRNASIVDGATDELTYINLGTEGIDGIAVRNSTDHAYLVNTGYTVIIDGLTKTAQKIEAGYAAGGGSRVAINQTTGRIYVINSGYAGIINVFQD